MHKVEDLKIWRKAITLAKVAYTLASELPKDEKYGLSSQIKRSSVSVPANIAEGAGRNSKKEFNYFLGIANGSCYELHTQLVLLTELNLVKSPKVALAKTLCVEIQKMNYNLMKSLVGSK